MTKVCVSCGKQFEPAKRGAGRALTCPAAACKLARRHATRNATQPPELRQAGQPTVSGQEQIDIGERLFEQTMPDDRALLFWSTDSYEPELEKITTKRRA